MPRLIDVEQKFAAKVLSIDPAYSFNGTGCGVAIINKDPECFGGSIKRPVIHRVGVIQPFSSESSPGNMFELAGKIRDIWREDEGYSSFPEILVIER